MCVYVHMCIYICTCILIPPPLILRCGGEIRCLQAKWRRPFPTVTVFRRNPFRICMSRHVFW